MNELTRLLLDAKGDSTYAEIALRAKQAGFAISESVVAKYMQGRIRRPSEDVLAGLAVALRLDVRDLRAAASRQRGELGPYVPVDVAASLTEAQRFALDRLIVAIVGQGEIDAGTAEAQKSPSDVEASLQPLIEAGDPSTGESDMTWPAGQPVTIVLDKLLQAGGTVGEIERWLRDQNTGYQLAAARTGRSRRADVFRAQDQAGEDNQDPGEEL